MNHVATISKGLMPNRPFYVKCSCGVAGDFPDKESASAYMDVHRQKLGGISTFELVDNSETAAPEAGSVNFSKPDTDQPASPPPPPPAPDAKKEE